MRATAEIRVGISGWTYEGWRGSFYPKKLPHHQELAFASSEVNSIEINGTFYSLQSPKSYEKWYASVPDGFIFSVKANRFITHVRRLNDVGVPIANFFGSGVLRLREKLGPILWQFPPSMKYDKDRFERFLDLLPHDTLSAEKFALKHRDAWLKKNEMPALDEKRSLRHAIEVRHESFRSSHFLEQLKEHKVALVMSHSSGAWPYFEELTADFVYARLHGEGELYSGGYGDQAIDDWAKKIKKWSSSKNHRDVYLYFDNDIKVKAPFDAMELLSRLHLRKSAKAA